VLLLVHISDLVDLSLTQTEQNVMPQSQIFNASVHWRQTDNSAAK